MRKILKYLVLLSVIFLWNYYAYASSSVDQAIAEARSAAASRPWAVVHWYNPKTWEVTWWCSNWAVRWRIPVIPWGPPDKPGEPRTQIWWTCSTYISSYVDNWSICSLVEKWQSNNTIRCKQTHSWSPVESWCWYSESHYNSSWALISTTCNTNSCPSNAPVPWVKPDNTAFLSIWNPITWDNWAYANNLDSNDIQVPINALGILWWASVDWWDNIALWKPWKISQLKAIWWSIAANRITKTWTSALNFQDATHTQVFWWGNNWWINITWIKSLSPLYVSDWNISFKAWDKEIKIDEVSYHFKKPFTWKIDIYDEVKKTWESSWIQIWTSQQYRLVWKNNKNINISDYKITSFINQIKASDEISHFISKKSVKETTLKDLSGAIFFATINTSSWATRLGNPWIKLQTPIVSYKFWWVDVSYYLNDEEEWDNFAPLINNNSKEFMWVRVIWWIQWAWKSEFTGQKANISNLYNSDLRTQIRKNSFNYIKNMKSWDIVNWVKYINWDITISWNQNYETLVVENGNVIIDWDLNISKKKLWIIVLKDGFNVNKDFNWKWNIYVKPDVEKINAIIYADWWFISSDEDWNPYITDSIDRTKKLQNQLIMHWTLFTRNTIGWSILAWWKYIIPWWSKGDNFDLAMLYDLNYIRRWNISCDKNDNNNCIDKWEYKDPFVIIYDNKVQIDPPKLFWN